MRSCCRRCRCCHQLYTDEYIFVLSAEDQLRLGLVTPVVPDNVPILSLGVQELSLQRSTFFLLSILSSLLWRAPQRVCVLSRAPQQLFCQRCMRMLRRSTRPS